MLNAAMKRRLVVCHYAECRGAKIFAEKRKKFECLAASKNFSNNFERKKLDGVRCLADCITTWRYLNLARKSGFEKLK
jgi:hypothetical protein